MKYFLTFSIFIFITQYGFSQHYGSIVITPSWTNKGPVYFYDDPEQHNKDFDYNFGYSDGYQGLLFAQKRISLTYGLQYSFQSQHSNFEYNRSNLTALKHKSHAINIPVSMRYNILKGKSSLHMYR